MKVILFIVMALPLLFAAACACAGDIDAFVKSAFSGENAFLGGKNTFEIVSETIAGTTRIGRAADPMASKVSLGGKQYEHGLGLHANTQLRITFGEPVKSFSALGGIDGVQKKGSPASVGFRMAADGKEVFPRTVLRAEDPVIKPSISLEGVRTLEIFIDDAGDGISCDQFDLCDAYFVTAAGETLWLEDLAGSCRVRTRFPFSFTLGGKASELLLPEWRFETKESPLAGGVKETAFVWTSPEDIEVRAEVKTYPEFDTADWTVWIENKGNKDTEVFSDFNALSLEVTGGLDAGGQGTELFANKPEDAPQKDVVLYQLSGSEPVGNLLSEFVALPQYVTEEKSIHIEDGRLMLPTYGKYSPYWALKVPGGTAICGLGWTGWWKNHITRTGNTVKTEAGFPRERFNTYLKPGEKVRSARAALCLVAGNDMQKAFNKWRGAMIWRIGPKKNGKPANIPIAACTSVYDTIAEAIEATEETDMKSIKAMEGLGYETLWMDAWYTRGKWTAGIGNYHLPIEDMVDPDRFPHGLEPLVEEGERLGMDILLWFGPESPKPGTYISKEHPEWVMGLGTDDPDYALGEKEAVDYLAMLMTAAIKKYHIAYWRNDSGISGANLDTYYPEDAREDRRGISEYKYVTGLYDFYDALLRDNPGLVIDNCCGGGTRLDLELMSRTISVWRTDTGCGLYAAPEKSALMNQVITASMNYFIPWSASGTQENSPYYIRSGFNNGLSYIDPYLLRPGFNGERMAKACEEMKRLRPYTLGNFSVLWPGDNTTSSLCAWQYSLKDRGCLFVFRREDCPYLGMTLSLRDIDPKKKYAVRYYKTYDLDREETVSGEKLLALDCVVEGQPGSLLVEYEEVK
ncbi:MAG: alpha-galactosidase [Abditibacteriota bacterium]|nr:alpha-galactosidase [Abditibacteriota bacterium]